MRLDFFITTHYDDKNEHTQSVRMCPTCSVEPSGFLASRRWLSRSEGGVGCRGNLDSRRLKEQWTFKKLQNRNFLACQIPSNCSRGPEADKKTSSRFCRVHVYLHAGVWVSPECQRSGSIPAPSWWTVSASGHGRPMIEVIVRNLLVMSYQLTKWFLNF